ncbi:MAG: DUF4446 family protein [Cellulosilyticaceae bacterium]
MDQIITMLNQYQVYITAGIAIFLVIIFIMFIVEMNKMKKVQKKYEVFMQKEDVDLEMLLTNYAQNVKRIQSDQMVLEKNIEDLNMKFKKCTQKVGMVRYNAYEKNGANLSFAIALLDAYDNGVVINAIYGRDGSYTYAKPIENSTSSHNLSEEEKEAIVLAKTNKSSDCN